MSEENTNVLKFPTKNISCVADDLTYIHKHKDLDLEQQFVDNTKCGVQNYYMQYNMLSRNQQGGL